MVEGSAPADPASLDAIVVALASRPSAVPDGDADARAPPLRAAVSDAARAALLAGRYVDHAALHSLELALVDVHHRLAHARPALVDSHAVLLQRIDAIL